MPVAETAREILNDLVRIQKRLAIIIQLENFKDDLERMVSIAFLKLLQTNKSKNCLDLNDSINDAVSAYHERYIQLKYVYF